MPADDSEIEMDPDKKKAWYTWNGAVDVETWDENQKNQFNEMINDLSNKANSIDQRSPTGGPPYWPSYSPDNSPPARPPPFQPPTGSPPPADSPQYAPYSPAYNSDSPGYVPSSPYGGSINVFPSEPNMNAAFNMLGGESQAQILQMPQDQRGVVMRQIMLKSARQSEAQSGGIAMNKGYGTNTDSSPLVPYFTRLPMEKQAQALKGGYSAMSNEFNNLAKKVEDQNPLITLKKPVSMQDQLAGKFPMIAVKSEKAKSTTTTSDDSSSSSSSSSSSDDNSKSSSSSDSSVRKITF